MKIQFSIAGLGTRMVLVLGLAVMAQSPTAPAAETTVPNLQDIDKVMAAAEAFQPGMSREPFDTLEQWAVMSQPGDSLRRNLEKHLAALLETNASLEAKRLACRQLWTIGTVASLPALEKLLANPDTVSMACFALRNYPSGAADAVLREALEHAAGVAQLNILGTVADRRDDNAVPFIENLAASSDPQVRDAAIAALGAIGSSRSAAVLEKFIARENGPVKQEAEFAALQCAQHLMQAVRKAEAAVLLKHLYDNSSSAWVRRAALIGRAQMGGRSATDLIIEAMKSTDPLMRATAIAQIPDLKESGAGKRLIALLKDSPPEVQALLIDALAARDETAARKEIEKLVAAADVAVATSAIRALGRFGEADSAPVLLPIVLKQEPPLQAALAADSLRELEGNKVDEAVLSALKTAPPSAQPAIIEVLTGRGATAAVPVLLELTGAPDAKVAAAAFKALGWLMSGSQIEAMIGRLMSVANPEVAEGAEQAVIQLSKRIEPPDQRSTAIMAAYNRPGPAAGKASLLRILTVTAGPAALDLVEAATRDTDETISDAAVRALANWPDASALPRLLAQAKAAGKTTHQVLLLRGYLRLLELPSTRTPQETLKAYSEAMQLAKRPDEKKMVLSGLTAAKSPGATSLIEPLLNDAAVQQEAALAAVANIKARPNMDKAVARRMLQKVVEISSDTALKAEAKALMAKFQ